MDMRSCAVIIEDGKILLMYRIKNWKEYFTLPWWWVEENENPTQTAIREVKEETTLDIQIEKELFHFENDFDHRMHYVYLAKDIRGTATLSWPEWEISSKNNFYMPQRHPLQGIQNLNIIPKYLKENLQRAL